MIRIYLPLFISMSILLLGGCASRQPGVCGNAAFGFDASPEKPLVENSMDPAATLRLIAVRRDGTATFQFVRSGKRITLRPGEPYHNPKDTGITITLTSADTASGKVRLTEQLVP